MSEYSSGTPLLSRIKAILLDYGFVPDEELIGLQALSRIEGFSDQDLSLTIEQVRRDLDRDLRPIANFIAFVDECVASGISQDSRNGLCIGASALGWDEQKTDLVIRARTRLAGLDEGGSKDSDTHLVTSQKSGLSSNKADTPENPGGAQKLMTSENSPEVIGAEEGAAAMISDDKALESESRGQARTGNTATGPESATRSGATKDIAGTANREGAAQIFHEANLARNAKILERGVATRVLFGFAYLLFKPMRDRPTHFWAQRQWIRVVILSAVAVVTFFISNEYKDTEHTTALYGFVAASALVVWLINSRFEAMTSLFTFAWLAVCSLALLLVLEAGRLSPEETLAVRACLIANYFSVRAMFFSFSRSEIGSFLWLVVWVLGSLIYLEQLRIPVI